MKHSTKRSGTPRSSNWVGGGQSIVSVRVVRLEGVANRKCDLGALPHNGQFMTIDDVETLGGGRTFTGEPNFDSRYDAESTHIWHGNVFASCCPCGNICCSPIH